MTARASMARLRTFFPRSRHQTACAVRSRSRASPRRTRARRPRRRIPTAAICGRSVTKTGAIRKVSAPSGRRPVQAKRPPPSASSSSGMGGWSDPGSGTVRTKLVLRSAREASVSAIVTQAPPRPARSTRMPSAPSVTVSAFVEPRRRRNARIAGQAGTGRVMAPSRPEGGACRALAGGTDGGFGHFSPRRQPHDTTARAAPQGARTHSATAGPTFGAPACGNARVGRHGGRPRPREYRGRERAGPSQGAAPQARMRSACRSLRSTATP